MNYPRPHLRADGNLSYLQFIDLVHYLWDLSHPDIPFVPAGNTDPAKYPSIVYAMQLSKTHPSDPKPHFREMLDNDTDTVVAVSGQRFQIVVSFSAVTEAGDNPDTDLDNAWAPARLAEEMIEAFEDFMLEFTPLFKRLGLSEIVYARRLPDREETRPGAGTIWRTTSYMITTEKIVVIPVEKLRRIHIDIRRKFAQESLFFLTNSDGSIDIFGQEFKIGDKVAINYAGNAVPHPNLPSAMYTISNIVIVGENRRYYLADSRGNEVEDLPAGVFGYVALVFDDVDVELYDQYSAATPDQDF